MLSGSQLNCILVMFVQLFALCREGGPTAYDVLLVLTNETVKSRTRRFGAHSG
jgi:hypothetical protein